MFKKRRNTISLCLLYWLICVGAVWAGSQKEMTEVRQANFELAQKFSEEQMRGMLKDTSMTPNWLPGSNRFWYRFQTIKEIRYTVVDGKRKTKAPLFNREKLAEQLEKLNGKSIDPNHLPIDNIRFDDSQQTLYFQFEKQMFQYVITSDSLTKAGSLKEPGQLAYGTYSPDEKWVVYARNYNLYMQEIPVEGASSTPKKLEERQLTADGECYYGYSDYSYDFVDAEKQDSNEPQRASVVWSPDATKFTCLRTDVRHLQPMFVMNSLSKPRPSLVKFIVSLPDDEVRKHEIWIYNLSLEKMIRVKGEKWHGQEYRSFYWNPGSTRFYMVRNSKDQLKGDLLAVDPGTGDVKVLIEERDAGMILSQPVLELPGSKELVWYSRRDGYGHYYLFDLQGKLKQQITKGRFNVQGIIHLDEKKRIIYFLAYGDNNEGNPYYTHFYKVHLDGSGLKRLTPKDAHHDIRVSPDNTCFIDNFSRVDRVPGAVLRDMNGDLIMELESADISLLTKSGWKMPTIFKEKASDGKMDIWGVMWKPFDFDPGKKYPVVTFVYPGPQDELIPLRFFERNENTHLAQYGFIVLMYGNRGGSQVRSLEYSESYRGNLRDYGIQDKKVVIERLAKKYSFMDLNRVGIWGGSSGGYMAVTAMLLNPEFYKVCVSRSGVQDPSVMYRWWVDSFQGITETTDENGKVRLISKKVPSNLEIADRLQGRLLLIQGEADVIVHPANAIRLADVLMSMHKRFDYILVPGGGHGASKHWGYIKKRIWLYFIEHLLGDQRYQNSIDLSSFMTREIPGKIR